MYWRFLNIMAKKTILIKLIDAVKTFITDVPKYQTSGSAAVDLVAAEDYNIRAQTTAVVKTAHKMQIPEGYVGLVCSRSGMASKHSVFVLNSPGVIDSDFRGDVGVILHNSGGFDFTVRKGDRIAQLMILKLPENIIFEKVSREEWDKSANTERGEGGFGSTGK